MFAEVIINSNARALNKTFDYIVPKNLESKARIGARIFVPFGRGTKLDNGFIINLKEQSEFAVKEIAIIEDENSLSEENITLAKLMARKYFCNISDCIKLMLQPGTSSSDIDSRSKEKTGRFVYLNKSKDEIEIDIEEGILKRENHIKILKFLYDNNGIYSPDLEVFLDISSSILKTLEKNGYIVFKEEKLERNPFIHKNIKRDEAKILTPEQQVCYDGIEKDILEKRFSKNLIFGVTGSRKNRDLFKVDSKSFRNRKICNSISSRNIFNTSNGR